MTNARSKLDQLEARKRQLELSISRANASLSRKERTHRLIQKGALVETYFDIAHLSVEETEELLQIFAAFVKEKTPKKYRRS
ncbi:MAG: hypothetical protein UHX00_01245 [Caryophanon sp.]|nr:hypothetical protein [Caryophanon sp.]